MVAGGASDLYVALLAITGEAAAVSALAQKPWVLPGGSLVSREGGDMWHSGKVQVLHLSFIWPAWMLWGELSDERTRFTGGVPITAFLFSACTVPCSQSSS